MKGLVRNHHVWIAVLLLLVAGVFGCSSSSSPDEGNKGGPPQDQTPPAIASVEATDVTEVDVVFSETVDPATAQTASSYKLLTVNPSDAVAVLSATLQSDGVKVVLTTEPMTRFVKYTLEVNGVADMVGNAISTATQKPIEDHMRAGRIYTIAGTGRSLLGPDDVDPLQSDLYQPMDVTPLPDGRIFILDWNNHRVRYMKDGIIKTICGTGLLGNADPGNGVDVGLNHPTGVAVGPDGYVYIAAWHNSKILRWDPNTEYVDVFCCFSGARGWYGDGGPAVDAIINLPSSIVFGPDGNLYISDQANFCVRMIDMSSPDHVISTVVAKRHTRGFCGDGGPAIDACLFAPWGQAAFPAAHLTFDPSGNLYLADTWNHRVRKVSTDGTINTIAGNGVPGYGGDGGDAVTAQLYNPIDVAWNPVTHELYFSDMGNDIVRKISSTGVITTVAGIPQQAGTSPDGTRATESKLTNPYGIGFDADGNLYIADTQNHLVRIVYAN